MRENLFTRLFRRDSHEIKSEWNNNNLPIGSLQDVPFFDLRTLAHYNNDSYENGYPDIRAIANRFFTIKPYAIDANGKPLDKTPNALNCLARPNQQTSGVDFRDQLAVMTLVHDKVYILVWEKKGTNVFPATTKVREDSVAGYTFLEDVQEENIDGKLQYRVYVGNKQYIFYPYQVMSFYDVNPGNISSGYSPSRSARRWTRIDDYIADYQTGFFKNGAIPAGQFIVTAPTKTDYEDIVRNMQRAHRGAGKNNNVMYSWSQLDPITNKPTQSSVTWVPFNVTNKDMSLNDIFNQSNKKISAAFGVPAFIKGDAEAPNFATAQVIERSFVENKIRPFAIKKWARFQHELNRITGGLGYGITFDLPTPNIADENESKARTNGLNVTALTTLVTFGFTLDSSIDALGLPNNWKQLKQGSSMSTTINNDKPEVDEGSEVEQSPPGLSGGAVSTNPKVNNLSTIDQAYYQAQFEIAATNLMNKQIDDAIAGLDNENALATSDEDDWLAEMMKIVSAILLTEGILQWEQGKLLIIANGIEAPSTAYSITTDALTRYRKYLKTVYSSYTEDTSNTIRGVLEKSFAEQWTRQQTENTLRNIVTTDAWRIKRIGSSETNRSSAMGSVESMIKLQDETDATIEKTMKSKSGNPCIYCTQFIDKWIPVDSIMIKKGENVVADDGSIFVNNWDNNIGHDIHANGQCYPIYRVATNG